MFVYYKLLLIKYWWQYGEIMPCGYELDDRGSIPDRFMNVPPYGHVRDKTDHSSLCVAVLRMRGALLTRFPYAVMGDVCLRINHYDHHHLILQVSFPLVLLLFNQWYAPPLTLQD
jgi:hypothetical protein